MMILKHGKIKIRHICPKRLIRTFSGKILCCFQMKLITINDRKTVGHQKLNLESMPDTFLENDGRGQNYLQKIQ